MAVTSPASTPDRGFTVWKSIVHVLAGPLAYAWLMSRVSGDAALAFPDDPPITHGSGPDADRILLIGGPIVRGMGVASYDLALSGHMARQLAARTGRGVDIDTRGIAKFDTHLAAEALRQTDLMRYDAVVLMIGIREVMSLRSPLLWNRDIRRLLEVIKELSPRSLPVLIVGVAPFARAMDVPSFVADWLDHAVERQNAETRRACLLTDAAEYVEFAPALTGIRYGRDASAMYQNWASELVPTLARALADEAPVRFAMAEPHVNEQTRQQALDDLGVLKSTDTANANHIVEMAVNMLGVDSAAINFIDHERQWSQATSGFEGVDLARAGALCDVTIQSPGVHLVEDVDQIAEFDDATWRRRPGHTRFYAGYPLEAPGGERVGALCVMSRMPRVLTQEDVATLRDLALRAQSELWEKATKAS